MEVKEWQHQVDVFTWAASYAYIDKRVNLLNGSLNGVKLSIGQAVKAKRTGMKKGYPDISLPVACGGYHGLFIELKRKYSGVVGKEQKLWLKALNDEGYKAEVCRGADEAIDLIIRYLKL